MQHIRVTALGLSALLLLASPTAAGAGRADASPAAGPPGDAVSATVGAAAPKVAPAVTKGERDHRRKPRFEVLPPTDLQEPARGAAAIRQLGDDLPVVAAANDLTAAELRTTLREDTTLWVAPTGQLVVKEQVPSGGAPSSAVAAPSAPLDQTFSLHSLPGSRHTLYLDFDGVDVTAQSVWAQNVWAQQTPLPAGSYEGWDPMGDGPGFSADERAAIQDIWTRVAEDYAPFDVDVTTADPGEAALVRDSADDTTFGTRLVITDSTSAPETLCSSQCGGIALMSQVDRVAPVSEPAWVFADLVSQVPKAIAEAASHEVGHTFGLLHDGLLDGTEYYGGHGTWAPIMGAAYNRPVTQWSHGYYDGANNTQDDVGIITGIAGRRTDEGGATWDQPLRVTDATAYISDESDVDTYLVDDCTAGARVAAVVTGGGAANLDVDLTVSHPGGSVVAHPNPLVSTVTGYDEQPWYGGAIYQDTAAGLDADAAVPEGGPYVVQVASSLGWTSDDGRTDYSTDGSLGAYRLVVQGCSTPDVAPSRPTGLTLTVSGTDLVATWAAPANSGGQPVTGYRVTLNGKDAVDLGADVTTRTFPGAATRNSTVAVRAISAVGVGGPASATYNPTTVPSQVTDVTVATEGVTCSGLRSIRVAWTSPASNGGSTITGYKLLQRDGDGWFKLFDLPSTGHAERSEVCFNPYPGEVTDYRIVALNANGEGEAYDFTALLKGKPTRITPTITTDRDARTVTVDWATPFDGGEPIQRIFLTLTTGTFANPVTVTLPPDATTYTFTGVRTGHKHVLLAASNLWGPANATEYSSAQSDTSFDMPAISPFPDRVEPISIRVTSADRATGTLRVAWDPVVPADPGHDPILWYDVCVDVPGGIHLPGDADFGDGATRGTDLCEDRTTLALTADATSTPHIDLTGLTIGDHLVSITPVNPGGPGYLSTMATLDFKPTAITCPASYSSTNHQLTWAWEWTDTNVNYWSVRTRRAPETAWTVVSDSLPYFMTSIPISPGQWEVEVTAHLRNGRTGAPVVCGVTVPDSPVTPTDPTPTDPTPTDPTPTDPTPTTPDVPEVPPVVTPPAPPVVTPPAPTGGTTTPTTPAPPRAPDAPGRPTAKPGGKGGKATVTVSWAAPRSTGSGPLTGYEVVVYRIKNGKPVVASRTTVAAGKRVAELTLRTGSYQVAVRARNAAGWSPMSSMSKSVSPR